MDSGFFPEHDADHSPPSSAVVMKE